MRDQGAENPEARAGIPQLPSADEECNLVQRMDGNPEALAIQASAPRLNKRKIVGPHSIDKQRFIDSATESDGAEDECDEEGDHDRHRRSRNRIGISASCWTAASIVSRSTQIS